MDIHFNTVHILIKEDELATYEEKLQKKYGIYDFAKKIDVKINQIHPGTIEVSLNLQVEKGAPMHAADTDNVISRAFNNAVKKLNKQLEKYKDTHYRSSRKSDITTITDL
ncbi:MAG: HPF/RaiA family ribosome-associated protein [Saprospiraceae bacterium]|nr:HPF/RaiA family ribosome-associated protein [Bacteroidia bacterium]MBT8230575.1 HPF/RaiA family ribosome-associated protein [Bacteroidia bacterium]NNF22868.1 HPF/RaiA family ribosome-associated protein [Saprospiraceae bacterium]NNK90055.1 HPF/RaiA family ribosome-associated protein [Saprospiraceae bacterium]